MTHTIKVMEDNLSHIILYDVSQEERDQFVGRVINAVNEGHINPLDLHLYLKNSENILDSIIKNKDFKDALIKEANKHGKAFDYRNASAQVKETSVKWDYENCNDTELLRLTTEFLIAKNKLEARQKFLQHVSIKGVDVLDPITGELITVYPPVKKSTTTVAISLK